MLAGGINDNQLKFWSAMQANLAGPTGRGVTIFGFFNAAAMMQVHEPIQAGSLAMCRLSAVAYPHL